MEVPTPKREAATLVVAVVHYVPSGVVTSPSTALRAAAFVALGWTTIHSTVRFYAAHAGQYAVYGALSGVIVVLTSLYAAAVVLLGGIIVNAWAAESSGDRLGSRWA